jgi:hypothetical protein
MEWRVHTHRYDCVFITGPYQLNDAAASIDIIIIIIILLLILVLACN